MNSTNEAYKKIIEERMDKLDHKIKKLQNKRSEASHFIDQIEQRIAALQFEYNQLANQKNDLDNRESLGKNTEKELKRLESSFQENFDDATEIQQRINNLIAVKNTMTTTREKKRAQSEIDNYKRKLELLKKKGAFYTKVQYSLMFPKYKYDLLKQSFLLREIGKYEYLASKSNDLDKLVQANDDKKDSFEKKLKNLNYIREQKRIGRAVEYRKKLIDEYKKYKDKNIFVLYGTSLIVMAKEVKERIEMKFDLNKTTNSK